MCVCVCVRERERAERGGGGVRPHLLRVLLLLNNPYPLIPDLPYPLRVRPCRPYLLLVDFTVVVRVPLQQMNKDDRTRRPRNKEDGRGGPVQGWTVRSTSGASTGAREEDALG